VVRLIASRITAEAEEGWFDKEREGERNQRRTFTLRPSHPAPLDDLVQDAGGLE
jgi:hypothetical protein